jgi:hypothetical protein
VARSGTGYDSFRRLCERILLRRSVWRGLGYRVQADTSLFRPQLEPGAAARIRFGEGRAIRWWARQNLNLGPTDYESVCQVSQYFTI